MYITDSAGWDLKSPNPVFVELLRNKDLIKPGKLLITGCGKGYDAVAAAKAGFDVTAVDFSPVALEHARELAESELVRIKFVEEDIFTLGNEWLDAYDVVYEYTTYCAINPSRRKEFAQKISSFIKPGGKLLALIFPVDEREGDPASLSHREPPFRIDLTEFYRNFSEFLQLEFSSKRISSVKPRENKEVLQIYIKPLQG
jgi:SAM-dependent methyltransferase